MCRQGLRRAEPDDARVVHHLGHDHHVIGGLHDRVIVVVEVVGQHRWPGVGAERHQTALGERPVFRVVVFVELALEGAAFPRAALALLREWGPLAIRRIDDQRAADLPVEDRVVVAPSEVEVVVASDPARCPGGPVSPNGWSRAVRVAWSSEERGDVRIPLFSLGSRVRRHDQVLTARPRHRRQRLVGPVALQVRVAIGSSRHDPSGICGLRHRGSSDYQGHNDDAERQEQTRKPEAHRPS